MTRRLLNTIAALALAAVFVFAAVPKLADPHDFALAIHRHQFAPPWSINLLAIYLPWLELSAAGALLVPRYRRAAALLLLALLVAFTALLVFNLWRGLDIACGCFSVESEGDVMGWINVVRNGALIALAAMLALRCPRR